MIFFGIFVLLVGILAVMVHQLNSVAKDAEKFDNAVRDFVTNEIDEMYE